MDIRMLVSSANIVRLDGAALAGTGVWSEARARRHSNVEFPIDGFERSGKSIYAGLVSREQAARGAVVGQYLRIAQLQEQSVVDPGVNAGGRSSGPGNLDARFAKRDLLTTMLRYMTGTLPEHKPGECFCERI